MILGVGVPPLACCAACPWFLARGPGVGVAVGAVGVRTGRGWSGCCGGRTAGGEEAEPFVLAVPAVRQVQGEVGVLSNRELEASDTPILPGQRAPFTLTRPKAPLSDRWIEA